MEGRTHNANLLAGDSGRRPKRNPSIRFGNLYELLNETFSKNAGATFAKTRRMVLIG